MNLQKLQRLVIDALEDVKAQDIVVFDTEHLSPLFERVVVASGTSNRQTKALAASVLDAVRDAGFAKPRVEGEGNGEWIIVDCGQAVVHIMQPNFRQYYHLEEIWGEKPVRLKLGAAKPVVAKPAVAKPASKVAAKSGKATAKKVAAKKTPVSKATAKKTTGAAKPALKAPAKKSAPTKKVVGAPKPVKAAAKKNTAKPAAKKAVSKAPRARKSAA